MHVKELQAHNFTKLITWEFWESYNHFYVAPTTNHSETHGEAKW